MDVTEWSDEKAKALGVDYDPCEYWVEKAKQVRADLQDRKDTIASYEELKKKLEGMLAKTRHKVMVPCGKLAMMEATVVNTNDLVAFLGDSWFANRSVLQSKEIIDRRLAVIRKNHDELEADLADCNKRLKLFDEMGGLDKLAAGLVPDVVAAPASATTPPPPPPPSGTTATATAPGERKVTFGGESTRPAASNAAAPAPRSCLRSSAKSNEMNFVNTSEAAQREAQANIDAGRSHANVDGPREGLFPKMQRPPPQAAAAAASVGEETKGLTAPVQPQPTTPPQRPASATLTAAQKMRIMMDIAELESQGVLPASDPDDDSDEGKPVAAAPAAATQAAHAPAATSSHVDDILAQIAAMEARGETPPPGFLEAALTNIGAGAVVGDGDGDTAAAMSEAELQRRMQETGAGGVGLVDRTPRPMDPRTLDDGDSNDYEEEEECEEYEEGEEAEGYDPVTRSTLVSAGVLAPKRGGGGACGLLSKLDDMAAPDAEAPKYANPADIFAGWTPTPTPPPAAEKAPVYSPPAATPAVAVAPPEPPAVKEKKTVQFATPAAAAEAKEHGDGETTTTSAPGPAAVQEKVVVRSNTCMPPPPPPMRKPKARERTYQGYQ